MGILNSLKFWFATIRDLILLFIFIVYVYFGVFLRWIFPSKLKSLKDEIILVTGSASGIGRQLCLKLASLNCGVKLICWDLSKRENTALIMELRTLGADAVGFEVDVSDLCQVQRIALQVKEQIGDVTMIINNAGIMPCHQFLSHNPREITRAFSVNVYGPMWILREFLPSMITKKKGHIVTICSATGLIGSRNLVAYSGTKHGLNGIIESLRDEIRMHKNKPKIIFTTVYPSPCNTSFSRNIIHSRFPWLIPIMTEPQYVADKSIEGIRKDLDYVYIPPFIQFMSTIIKALPPKIYWAVLDFMGVYTEPKENTKFVGKSS